MKTFMKTALTCFCIFMTSTNIFSQWERTNGPEGISIGSLLNVGGTLYAGTATDGVYASTNGGVNWFPSNSGIETKGVLSLASGTGYLYAGTNGYGVYHSTNGGQTWLPPSNENSLYVKSMAVKDSYIFACAQGVYRSSDNGATWTKVIPINALFSATCVSGNKVFASEYNYTLVSTNNGVNWSYVNDLEGSAGFSFYCNGNFIYAGGVSEIYRSTDQGNSFVQIPINFGFSIVNIYSITSIGSTLFAATSYNGVYKSSDNGSTWASANTGMGPKDTRTLAVTGSSSLIAGAHYAGVFRSTNQGSSWIRSMSGFPAGSSVSGLFASGSTVLAGTYDGLFRSTDNGLTWDKITSINDTVNYSHIRGICIKGGTIFIGTIFHFHSTVYKSTDNGVTWERSGNGFPSNLSFINSLIVSGSNILAATSEGVYYSSNNGDNWIHANAPNQYLLSIAKGGGYVYAPYGNLGSIYRSVDNGENWSLVVHTGIDYTAIGARDNFACVGSFFTGAQVTSNFGISWSGVSGISGTTSVLSVFYVTNSDITLAAVYPGPYYIYRSSDNGLSFSPYSDGLGPNATAEWFTATDSFLIAGTDYNGVWRRLRPELVGVASQEQGLPVSFQLNQNYPNPFNPSTKITYSIPKAGFVSLKIYNMLGQEVAVLVDEYKTPGVYTKEFNASNLSSGVYYYGLISGQFTITRKMVLIK
jgi:photosystem II stability/assembly factor-like uncharacterized protein